MKQNRIYRFFRRLGWHPLHTSGLCHPFAPGPQDFHLMDPPPPVDPRDFDQQGDRVPERPTYADTHCRICLRSIEPFTGTCEDSEDCYNYQRQRLDTLELGPPRRCHLSSFPDPSALVGLPGVLELGQAAAAHAQAQAARRKAAEFVRGPSKVYDAHVVGVEGRTVVIQIHNYTPHTVDITGPPAVPSKGWRYCPDTEPRRCPCGGYCRHTVQTHSGKACDKCGML